MKCISLCQESRRKPVSIGTQKLTKHYGFELKIGKNFSELRKHMVFNHQKPPKGINIKAHYKNREKAWKNLKGQNVSKCIVLVSTKKA